MLIITDTKYLQERNIVTKYLVYHLVWDKELT